MTLLSISPCGKAAERIYIDGDLILSIEEEQLLGSLEFNAVIDLGYEEEVQNQVVLAGRRGVAPDRRCAAQPEHV